MKIRFPAFLFCIMLLIVVFAAMPLFAAPAEQTGITEAVVTVSSVTDHALTVDRETQTLVENSGPFLAAKVSGQQSTMTFLVVALGMISILSVLIGIKHSRHPRDEPRFCSLGYNI